MRTFYLILFNLLWLTIVVDGQIFTGNDIQIGDSTINYVNPEFSPEGDFMVWMEIDTSNGVTGKVWHCGVNPSTGDLIPPNGKGFNAFYSNIYSRPADWGLDSLGPYYVGATLFGQVKFVRPESPTHGTVVNISLPPMNKRRAFYPSQLPGVNKRFVSYILNDSVNGFSSNSPQNQYYQLRVLNLDNPSEDYLIEQQPSWYPGTIPMDIIVPRWIKGSYYLTYGSLGLFNKVQAKEFNINQPFTPGIFVTGDNFNKIDGNSSVNPTNGKQFFLSGINASDSACFYFRPEFGNMFNFYKWVVPVSVNLQNASFNQSHEPFNWNGKIYSTFQINNTGEGFFGTTFNEPGEIWLANIDSTETLMWLLSDFKSEINVSEPEPFVGSEKVWVYYSASVIDSLTPFQKRVFQLRRCETPLRTTTKIDLGRDKKSSTLAGLNNYPNPFNPATTISFTLDKSDFVTLELYNVLGEKVVSLLNDEKSQGFHTVVLDMSGFPGGIYICALQTGSLYETHKIVLLK